MDNNRVQEAELLKLPGDLLRNIAPRMEKTAVLFTCTQLRRLALETAGSATVVGRFNSVNAAILNNCSSLRALSLCSKAVAACNARKAYVESSIQHEVDDDVLRDMLGMPALAELRRLDLSCTAITDLAGLAGLSALEELYLQYVNGDAAGANTTWQAAGANGAAWVAYAWVPDGKGGGHCSAWEF